MKHRLTALTLVELLVVMAITASLTGLGIAAALTFRNTLETRQAYSKVVTFIQEAQNRARNSVVSQQLLNQGNDPVGAKVAGYMIVNQPDLDQIQLYYCRERPSPGQYNCALETPGITLPNITVTTDNACQHILFTPNDIIGLRRQSGYYGSLSGTRCELRIRHDNTTSSGAYVIQVDLTNNVINFPDV